MRAAAVATVLASAAVAAVPIFAAAPANAVDAADPSALAAEAAALRERVEQARAEHLTAAAKLTHAERVHERAAHARDRLLERADGLDVAADDAAHTGVRAYSRGTPSAWVAMLSGEPGDDLLQRLAAAERVGALSADPARISGAAEELREEAAALRERAGRIGAERAEEHALAVRAESDLARAGLEALEAEAEAASQAAVAALARASWVSPLRANLTDRFGPRAQPHPDASTDHRGVDLAAACGIPVRAAAGGTVVESMSNGGLGEWVLIDHGGIQTGYAHLDGVTPRPAVGARVESGDVIGAVGSTGTSTGCHLHLETHVDGRQVDPIDQFARRGVVLGS